MSSHKNKLEDYVSEKLKGMYKFSRPTLGSGCTPIERGDIKNPYFAIECKMRSTKSFSIKEDVWNGIKSIAASESKDPVYIVENINKVRLAIMAVDDWINLVQEVIELRKERDDGK